MKDYPWGKGTPVWVRDATLNDSDKTFTVPAGKIWRMLSIDAELVATATVGNRVLTAIITDGANTVQNGVRSGNITASQRGRYRVIFGSAIFGTTQDAVPAFSGSQANVVVYGPMPSMILTAGCVIRVLDLAAIDAAADDLTVVLHYVEYDA